MKKIYVFLYYILFALTLLGCGTSGTCNNIGTSESNGSNISSLNIPITVERGPIFMATVTDANGSHAMNDNFGFSNIYQFTKQPIYPITVHGGYIDINRNGKLDNNDSKLDINMSSYSNVISPLTTLVGNDTTLLNYLVKYYDINTTLITTTVPSKISKNTIILSNIAYRALKNNYQIGSKEFNQTVEEINNLYQQFNTITDLNQLSYLLEEAVLNLEGNIERVTNEEIASIESNIFSQIINNQSETFNNQSETFNNQSETLSFNKIYKSTDHIQDIWNMVLAIPTNNDVNNINIGIHIIKNEPQTIGDIVIKNISIKNNQITHIDALNIFGKKTSGTTGSIGYNSTHDITQNAVALLQENSLLIKLGYIMEKQTIVSQESFKQIADYNVTIYVSNLDINGSPIINDYPLQLEYDTFYTFPKGTQRINGLISIGD